MFVYAFYDLYMCVYVLYKFFICCYVFLYVLYLFCIGLCMYVYIYICIYIHTFCLSASMQVCKSACLPFGLCVSPDEAAESVPRHASSGSRTRREDRRGRGGRGSGEAALPRPYLHIVPQWDSWTNKGSDRQAGRQLR